MPIRIMWKIPIILLNYVRIMIGKKSGSTHIYGMQVVEGIDGCHSRTIYRVNTYFDKMGAPEIRQQCYAIVDFSPLSIRRPCIAFGFWTTFHHFAVIIWPVNRLPLIIGRNFLYQPNKQQGYCYLLTRRSRFSTGE